MSTLVSKITRPCIDGQSLTTPEPHQGYGSTMLVVPTSSSKEFPVSYSDAWKRWSLTPET
jgi:hypothetical protein